MRWRSVLLVPVAMVVTSCAGDADGGATTVAGPAGVPTVSTAPTAPTVPTVPDTPNPATASAPTADPTAPDPTEVVAPTTTVPEVPAVVPEGFAARRGVITAADGTVCDACLWLAEAPADRARGLMGVTDLGGADGMVFVWDEPTQSNFWMRNTPTPLSIAFFAADGSFVSSTDMVPCLDGPDADCVRYAAAGPYTMAIEVPAGGLEAIAGAPGSVLQLLDAPCDPVAAGST